MVSIVSKKYSEALYIVGIERDNLKKFQKEIIELKEIFKLNKEIMTSLCHPEIPLKSKIQIIDELFSGKVSKEIIGLFNVILKKSRQEFIPEIFEAFIERCKEHENISTALVMSAEKLTDKNISRIKKELEKKTSKKIEIEERVDESLLGGIKIIVDNILFDGSIDGKIKKLNRAII